MFVQFYSPPVWIFDFPGVFFIFNKCVFCQDSGIILHAMSVPPLTTHNIPSLSYFELFFHFPSYLSNVK